MKGTWIIGLSILVVLISGCTSGTEPPKGTAPGDTSGLPVHTAPETTQTAVSLPMTATIENIDFSFYPAEMVVAKGATVTWKQKDYEKHTVTGTGFDSGELSQGQTFSHTFSEAGVFAYKCKLHPSMTGKIIVK